MMNAIQFQKPRIDPVPLGHKFHTRLDVLRLDMVHPIVSGNKWFKLHYYLEEALQQNKKAIVTFGGAFSNHIVATAAACAARSIMSIGIIRGERPSILSQSLQDALEFGMQLFFVSRDAYRDKIFPQELLNQYAPEDLYRIEEGGYGQKGAAGICDMLKETDISGYTHFIAAVGTGTTLAGMALACNTQQQAIGISVLKNHVSLEAEARALLTNQDVKMIIDHRFHCGGYAKKTPELIAFMNDWYRETGIPSDFVYTGKMFYAVHQLLQQAYFPGGSHLLMVHTGGLQGNRSLPKGTLIF